MAEPDKKDVKDKTPEPTKTEKAKQKVPKDEVTMSKIQYDDLKSDYSDLKKQVDKSEAENLELQRQSSLKDIAAINPKLAEANKDSDLAKLEAVKETALSFKSDFPTMALQPEKGKETKDDNIGWRRLDQSDYYA